MAVAFNCGAFGGAAKADRWAAHQRLPQIYFARVKTRRLLKERFTASLQGKAALQERQRMSRAEYENRWVGIILSGRRNVP